MEQFTIKLKSHRRELELLEHPTKQGRFTEFRTPMLIPDWPVPRDSLLLLQVRAPAVWLLPVSGNGLALHRRQPPEDWPKSTIAGTDPISRHQNGQTPGGVPLRARPEAAVTSKPRSLPHLADQNELLRFHHLPSERRSARIPKTNGEVILSYDRD